MNKQLMQMQRRNSVIVLKKWKRKKFKAAPGLENASFVKVWYQAYFSTSCSDLTASGAGYSSCALCSQLKVLGYGSLQIIFMPPHPTDRGTKIVLLNYQQKKN